ncbi:MAG: tetratricopeptide repeat protein [Deltaproteobacteria bacterium]|nr:tetratricopeptide repeat protein [Deltaproteobacteria bacterium]
MTTPNVQRKLAAIFSADVKGYSRLMGDDEVATIRTLTAYREVMASSIRQHRGRVVDAPGDNLLAEFTSVVDAVHCAIEVQGTLVERNATLPDQRKMEFRIGINVGDVIVEGERIYGDGVNIAARLEGLAEPGGICISGAVYDQVENKLTSLLIGYDPLGEQTVKNIVKPVLAYRVRVGEAPLLAPTQRAELLYASTISRSPELPPKPSIAVLPFANLSGDAEQEYFSDGITEDLITDLSKLSGLFVISRNSTFVYKGKAVKPEQLRNDLGVRYMLEGSVRKAANRVRITAQLVDVTTGFHLWADRYDRELQDIFAVQDEVTRKIVSALEVTLTEGEQKRMGRALTTNLEAYECFLRGLEFFAHRTASSNAQARRMFERAIALDPDFAAACARLGRACMIEWTFQWSADPGLPDQAEALARRAVALDETLPGAHQTLAYVHLLRKQFPQAVAEAERAVALDPNDADACVTLAEILSCAGAPQRALGLVQKALQLDPHYPPSYIFALGQVHYLNGQYEDALAAFKRVLTRNPEHERAYFFLGLIYSEFGRKAEALAALAMVKKLNPASSLQQLKEKVPYLDQNLMKRWIDQLDSLEALESDATPETPAPADLSE